MFGRTCLRLRFICSLPLLPCTNKIRIKFKSNSLYTHELFNLRAAIYIHDVKEKQLFSPKNKTPFSSPRRIWIKFHFHYNDFRSRKNKWFGAENANEYAWTCIHIIMKTWGKGGGVGRSVEYMRAIRRIYT